MGRQWYGRRWRRPAWRVARAGRPRTDLAASVEQAKAERSAARTGPYKHLMTGVSYMLPFVVAGGLLIALGFAFGGIYAFRKRGYPRAGRCSASAPTRPSR